MIDLVKSTELPTKGIPVFGSGPRLATSTDLTGGAPREFSVQPTVQLSRSETFQSLFSSHPNDIPLSTQSSEFIAAHFLRAQLEEVARTPGKSGARVSAAAMLMTL